MEGKAPWDLLESPVTLERPENRVRKVSHHSRCPQKRDILVPQIRVFRSKNVNGDIVGVGA